MKKRMLLVSAGVAALDQIIKSWVRTHATGTLIAQIPGIVAITHTINTGAAFSMLSGKTLLLAALSSALLFLVYVYAAKCLNLTFAARLALACMLGGGLGNLIDRLICGGVTDYIRLLIFDFPIFNCADAASGNRQAGN